MQMVLKNANLVNDGTRPCYDVVVTAGELHRAYKHGFLQVDDSRQRGRNTVTDKRVLKEDKIEDWTDKLIGGTAYLGQLTWNVRHEDGAREVEFDPATSTLAISALQAYLPDSAHRHEAVFRAVESIAKGSTFDLARKISLRIYNMAADEETAVFYAYNQEGEAADEGRSKWLRPTDLSKLAREFVVRSPHLGESNVDTVRDRLSKKSYRLASFGTISRAIEDAWSDQDVIDDEENFEDATSYLTDFWSKLVSVRKELGKLPLSQRQKVRSELLVDNALSISAYMRLAKYMKTSGTNLDTLEILGQKYHYKEGDAQFSGDFFSRQNPLWQKIGVLVPQVLKDGSATLNMRNARQTRQATYDAIRDILGLRDAASQAA